MPGPHDPARGRWLYDHADQKIIHFQANFAEIEKELGIHDFTDIHVIPNAIHDMYPNKIGRREAREKLKIPEDKHVLLCFGHVWENRGYEHFVEALRLSGDDYLGLIVGRPDHARTASRLQEEEKQMTNLRLDLRLIRDDEIQVFFNASDVIVLPYTSITTSGVVMLAFAYARPVIASRISCLVEVVRDDMGILVPPRNAQALAEAITEIFSKDHRSMGQRALEVAQKEYSWELVARKTAKAYSLLF